MSTFASASSIVLSGGTIIAFDRATEALQVIRNGSLLLQDDLIVDISDSATPSGAPADAQVVDVTDKIITPGFIDTHRHGWQTVFKTIGSNTSLVEYWYRYGEYASDGLLSADDVYISELIGLYEALNAGVTSTLDHAHHTWSNDTTEAGYQASIDSGARVFWCPSFHDVTNYTFSDVMAKFRDIAEKGAYKGTPTSLGIAYDGFSISPPQQAKAVVDLANEFNVSVITTHSLGGPWSVTNSPEDLQALGVLNISTPIVFSHGSYLTAAGATLLRNTNQYISITPESEMHYGHGHPKSHLIQDQAALGVDTHFTFSTDILTQARLWLQSTRYKLSLDVDEGWEVPANNPMSVNQAFLLATRHGGLALRRDDLGVIAKGAKADLVVWDGASPPLLGWADPVAAVMLHASVGDIDAVLVDGKFVKKDGKLTAAGYEESKTKFLATAKRIQAVWRALPPADISVNEPFPLGLGVFLTADTKTVDTLRGPGNGYGEIFT
ncbi:amidohydrolase [Thozetella sp. PMI_491]|nr:amidohydrolase [Thozetella sp. PMI_491]